MQIILKKPIITEVSMGDAKKGNFTFEVDSSATKTQIKNTVEKTYSVKVKRVRTVNVERSKTIMTKFGRKTTKKKFKKARVELQKGQTIPEFEIKEDKKK